MWLGSFNTVNGKRVHATKNTDNTKKELSSFNTVNGKRVHATRKGVVN